MKISRLTIDKLGIKLYDRVTAVLAELIANSYDADAATVTITLPWGTLLARAGKSGPGDHVQLAEAGDGRHQAVEVADAQGALLSSDDAGGVDGQGRGHEILIVDDGHGMTSDELNKQYLSVGADRRKRTGSDKSRHRHRPVMGRKGIGKLAPFGICETVEVITAGGEETPMGYRVSHIIMRLSEMLADTDDEYNPQPGEFDGTFSKESGTTVKLRDFFRKRVPSRDELDRQLSARFGLTRTDWMVRVVNSLNAQQSFELGTLKIDFMDDTFMDVSDMPVRFEDSFLPVTGFVAYSKKPYKDPAMAGVRIYARGKIVAQTRDFDIGAGFTGEFTLRSYLVGEIHAEWLDQEDDLVRSDRQDIIWHSDQGEALRNWGQKLTKALAKRGAAAMKKEKWAEFEKKSDLKKRLDQAAPNEPELKHSVTEAAKLLVKDVDPEALEDQDHVDRLTELAFSIGPHQTLLGTLREVSETTATTVDAVMALFQRARMVEMYSLGQVAEERLDVITKLEELIANGRTLERPLQELIEQAPWLLAPEWTPLGMNESLKRVRASFEAWYEKVFGVAVVTSAIDNERKEPDFVMLNDAGVLWIVEIKRLEYHLTDEEYQRGFGYLAALTKFLDDNPVLGEQFPIRRLTFVSDYMDKLSPVSLSSLNSDARVSHRTWHELLDFTKRAHRDFLVRVESSGVSLRADEDPVDEQTLFEDPHIPVSDGDRPTNQPTQ
ncbi:ATP-binding protein [Micromonospora cathayae]|uniref:ATP-binding protein n=1 Tax=Micromonospora cathayae TaxID=3028804 RepID=A0ABY7ZU08_9ACTN|nr:ATP-binding protein [Micromonospora sp. HUAS 3]WDZ86385.1 ATP-binding protein [Micromonospora sp. HUAS 3]